MLSSFFFRVTSFVMEVFAAPPAERDEERYTSGETHSVSPHLLSPS